MTSSEVADGKCYVCGKPLPPNPRSGLRLRLSAWGCAGFQLGGIMGIVLGLILGTVVAVATHPKLGPPRDHGGGYDALFYLGRSVCISACAGPVIGMAIGACIGAFIAVCIGAFIALYKALPPPW